MEYPPSQPGGGYGDTIGGLTIAGGIAGALFHRERTGEAVTVDCSLLAVGMWATAYSIAGVFALGRDRMPVMAREESPNPLVNIYRTADDRFVSLVMLQSDRYWPEFMEKIGRPDLVSDERFSDSGARGRNNVECVEVLQGIFAERSFDEWKVLLSDVAGVWSPVQTPHEVIDDPQVVANQYVHDVRSEDGSMFKLVAVPLQFDEMPAEITRAPNHAEHTDNLLQEIGLDLQEIMDLRRSGAVL